MPSKELSAVLERVRPAREAAAEIETEYVKLRAEHGPEAIIAQLDDVNRQLTLSGEGDPLTQVRAALNQAELETRRDVLRAELGARQRKVEVIEDRFRDMRQKMRRRLESEAATAFRAEAKPRLERAADLLHALLDELDALTALENEVSTSVTLVHFPSLMSARNQMGRVGYDLEMLLGRVELSRFDGDSFWRYREQRTRRGR